MESLDTTILNTAVPAIARDLNAAPLSLKSLVACYTLSLATLIPISGWVADRFGTRRVFGAAIGLFTIASVLCGLSSNMYMLLVGRVLQGAGGAMMVPVGRLTLLQSFDKPELIRVLSIVTIPGWMGPILGPAAGGAMITHFHWSFIFFVNVPIGVIGLILVCLFLPDYREKNVKPLDLRGFLLFGSGIALLFFVLDTFGHSKLNPIIMPGLLALSLVLIGGYGLHAARADYPLLKLSLFRIRTFNVAVSGSFLTRLGVGGVPFLLPLLYQIALGYTPMQSGLLILCQAFAGIAAKLALPRVLDRMGYRNVLITNTIILGSLLMLFATVVPGTPVWFIILQASCYGACTSVQYTSMNTMAYADIAGDQSSSAGSIVSTAQELSISLGIGAAVLAIAFFMPDMVHSDPREMGLGLQQAFLLLGGLTILTTLIFTNLKSGDGDCVTCDKHSRR